MVGLGPGDARPTLRDLTKALRRAHQLMVRSTLVAPVEYRRAAFGEAWQDTDHNGCNQRDDVLVRDAIEGTVRTARQGSCDHDVIGGQWRDPYSGAQITLTDAKDQQQAQRVQIDHLVPLENVWSSGGWSWSDARRVAYANDLENLLATGGTSNTSKGSRSPDQWLPAASAQCAYLSAWVSTKRRWHLTITKAEQKTLDAALRSCIKGEKRE